MIHELKELPEYFNPVIEGKKLFESRKHDRPFKVGDLLALNEWDKEKQEYTGRCCLVYIDYILNEDEYCKEGYITLGIKPCEVAIYNKFTRRREESIVGTYAVPLIGRSEEIDNG